MLNLATINKTYAFYGQLAGIASHNMQVEANVVANSEVEISVEVNILPQTYQCRRLEARDRPR